MNSWKVVFPGSRRRSDRQRGVEARRITSVMSDNGAGVVRAGSQRADPGESFAELQSARAGRAAHQDECREQHCEPANRPRSTHDAPPGAREQANQLDYMMFELVPDR
jgi:hypothetical protein